MNIYVLKLDRFEDVEIFAANQMSQQCKCMNLQSVKAVLDPAEVVILVKTRKVASAIAVEW